MPLARVVLAGLVSLSQCANSSCSTITNCKLRRVSVPRSVAWDGLTGERSETTAITTYWDRVRAAEGGSGRGLHALCGVLPGTRAKLAELASARAGGGLFLTFIGDSFMRINFVQLIRTIIPADSAVHEKMKYSVATYHQDHVVCCDLVAGADVVRNCTISFGSWGASSAELDRVKGGYFCAVWSLSNSISNFLPIMQNLAARELQPDLLVVNGGLHYPCLHPRGDAAFESHLRTFLDASAHLMRHSWRRTKRIVVGSTVNPRCLPKGFGHADRYAVMRRLVKKKKVTPAVDARTLFISLEDLAGADACGYTHTFPARGLVPLPFPDACNNTQTASDPHLAGGAYLHLVELELGWAVACRD